MIAMHRFIFFICFFSIIAVRGQSSEKYVGEYSEFYRGEELFEKEQYSAAREVFTEFLNNFPNPQNPQYIKARYYQGLSALELYNNDAIKMLMSFNNDYPENIYKNSIYFKIGEHFYQRKKYKDAKEWFDRTNPFKIDSSFIASYHFKLGYSNFQLGNLSDARNEFYEIKDGQSNYSQPALYYFSYIAYKNKAYQEALGGFLKLKENPVFEKEIPYYIVQIHYLLNDYKSAVSFAESLEVKDISDNTAEMNLIIGSSYYELKKYKEAIPYLEDYNSKNQATREEQYTLAFSYFKEKQYGKAITLFDRISRTKDKLAQISLYHIAQSYMQQEELNYARTAFKSASSFDFDKKVQEDAMYNYAVLSYKLDYNPYNESIKAFELFLQEFPKSERNEDIYNYMANVYLNTKNYNEAIKSLDRISNLSVKLKMAYQVVSYNMGIEKFERGDYKGSINALKNVNKYDISAKLTGQAKFWEADAYFMLQDWNNAIKNYRAFLLIPGIDDLRMREAAYYNVGYAYFNQKDWTQAIQAFRTYTALNNIQDKNRLADAYARIGDCYYTKDDPDFQRAALNYENSLNHGSAKKDQTLYSLSNVYKRIAGKRERQIEILRQITEEYPQSPVMITATFDLAISYKNSGNYDEAIANFNIIVENYPDNILVKDALIEIADTKFKQQKYLDAESYFKRVLNEYSLDNLTCKRVTKGIIDVYRVMRRQDEIVDLGKQYACAEITENDEELFFYETAAELYVKEKYDEAIPEINKYLNRFSDGRFTVQLLSYLADIYYRKGDNENTIRYYSQLIEYPNSIYTEQALIRSSKLLYNSSNYEQAMPYYKKLASLSSTPEVVFNACVGLMRTNYILKSYSDSKQAAVRVLEDALLNDELIRVEANFIAGMSLFYTENYENALEFLRWTADNTGKERGTEALYTLANAYYNMEDYETAEKLHNELLKRKPSYDFWIAKSLILQAKVFTAMHDMFQAEQTIDLVLENYPNQDDGILEIARQVKYEILQLKEYETIDNEEDQQGIFDFNNDGDE